MVSRIEVWKLKMVFLEEEWARKSVSVFGL
jgi:hypothetical protein